MLTEIDSSSGVLFPFYDVDTSMVYVGGKVLPLRFMMMGIYQVRLF